MKLSDFQQKTKKWNCFSATDTLGSFDFYTSIVSLDSLASSDVAIAQQKFLEFLQKQADDSGILFDPDSYHHIAKVFPLAVHEYTHFIDATSTLWGLRHLKMMKDAYEANDVMGGTESDFYQAKKYYSPTHSSEVQSELFEIPIMQPYSPTFRRKIIKAYEDESISQRKLEKRFGVAPSFVQKLLKQYRETDSVMPKVRTQQTPAKLNEEHLSILHDLVEERNDATIAELRQQFVAKTGLEVSCSTINRALQKLDLTLKKRHSMPVKRKVNGFN